MNANTDYRSTPPGTVLRAAREEKGISVDQVAESLHLRPAVVESLEAGRYQDFDSIVFLKGYFRSYCRLVGLHEERMAELLEGELTERKQELAEQEQAQQKETTKAKRVLYLKYLTVAAVILVVVVGALVFGFSGENEGHLEEEGTAPQNIIESQIQGGDSESGSSVQVDESEPLSTGDNEVGGIAEDAATVQTNLVEDSSSEELQGSDGPSISSQETTVVEQEAIERSGSGNLEAQSSEQGLGSESRSQNELEDEGAESDTQADTGASTGAETQAASAVPETLSQQNANIATGSIGVVFSGDCWVEIKNDDGRKLVAQLKRAGDTLSYTGALPLTLVLGDGRVAEVSFNGSPFDLTQYLRRNGVAQVRFD